MKQQPVLLLILDGWGLRDEAEGNAIQLAKPRHYEQLIQNYPWIPVQASGEAVGLPAGQMGNSEVGHLNMGAGRIVYQELTRIDKAIRDGDFFQNPALLKAMQHAKVNQSTLHLMGLVSDGGVHSSLAHLLALIKMAKDNVVEKLRVHAFLDGRDVPPKSAETYLQTVERELLDAGYPQIATIVGRYYAMDRDTRWERVQQAYDNIVSATGRRMLFSGDALQFAYNQDETDEFVLPTVCDFTYEGMQDNDAAIFFNFRPDRAREITQALTLPDFIGFERGKAVQSLHFVCMTMYDDNLDVPIAYPKQSMSQILAEVLSDHGIRQFRTAETEKYAHVTYFLNGGFETPYPGEERKLIPSPKVATYDLQPEMSLPAVCNEVVDAIESGQYQFIATNFANPDMVGHTGVLDAAVSAVEAVDACLGRVVETVLKAGWVMILTADHGNIEQMTDHAGGPHTAHTTELVPLILVSSRPELTLRQSDSPAALSQVAPTILDLMDIPQPPEMTSESVLVRQVSTVS